MKHFSKYHHYDTQSTSNTILSPHSICYTAGPNLEGSQKREVGYHPLQVTIYLFIVQVVH
ncbi:hypothetical protein C1H46_006967 [Malus baccata]|uniref:Uncharacterized protein n=1 Tax=Malus baccata TaxID=106549 RepID=A0A540N8D3_MALBA|nr:hypothetical protein C1H46_006967 [Malus baccata]